MEKCISHVRFVVACVLLLVVGGHAEGSFEHLFILTASVSCRARPCCLFPKDSAVPRFPDEGDCFNCFRTAYLRS